MRKQVSVAKDTIRTLEGIDPRSFSDSSLQSTRNQLLRLLMERLVLLETITNSHKEAITTELKEMEMASYNVIKPVFDQFSTQFVAATIVSDLPAFATVLLLIGGLVA